MTLLFWIVKILATTLGETRRRRAVDVAEFGYAVSTVILLVPFFVLVGFQIKAKRFHSWLYWAVIVGTTLAGTTMADFADRSLGIGYPGGRIDFVCVRDCVAAGVEVVGGHGFSGQHCVDQGGDFLLGNDFVFEHAGHCAGGLDERGDRVCRGDLSVLWVDCVGGRAVLLYQGEPDAAVLAAFI